MSIQPLTTRYAIQRPLLPPNLAKPVWLAKDLAAGDCDVVLKKVFIDHHILDKPSLFRICDAYLALSHENLARPLDIFPDGTSNGYFLVTEYANGKPFLPTINTLDHHTFIALIGQLCKVLYYLHSKGYAHLDLHPGNILIMPPRHETEPWTLRVIDLPLLPLAILRTHPSTLSIHPDFSAPEVLSAQSFDFRADLYSLGALITLALCPTVALSERPTREIRGSTSLNPEQVHSSTPPYLTSIVTRLLHPDPERRFPSAYYLLEDLNASLRQATLETIPNIVPDTIPHQTPTIPCATFLSLTNQIDNLLNSHDTRWVRHISLAGPTGSGRKRISSAALLMSKLKGCSEIVLQKRSHGEIRTYRTGVDHFSPENHAVNTHVAVLDNTSPITPHEALTVLAARVPRAILITCTNIGWTARPIQRSESSSPNYQLVVGQFRQTECTQFIDHLLSSNQLSTDIKNTIAQYSLYHPGILRSMLDYYTRKGLIYRKGAIWTSVPALLDGIPPTTEVVQPYAAVFSDFDLLSSSLLRVLAAAKYPMPLSCLQLLLGVPAEEVSKAISELSSYRLLVRTEVGVELTTPTVATVIEVIHGAGGQQDFARDVFERLELIPTSAMPQRDAILARVAASAALDDKTIFYSLQAATSFESSDRLEDALSFCRFAVDRLSSENYLTHIPLLRKYLELLDRTGDKSAFAEAASRLVQVLPEAADLERAQLYTLMAKHYSDLLDLKRSSHFAGRAIAISRRTANVSCISACLEVLAQNRLRQGRPLAAIKVTKASLKLRGGIQSDGERIRSISAIAGAYYIEGDFPRALRYAQQAVRCATGSLTSTHRTIAFNNLGILLMESGHLARADHALTKCRDLAVLTGDLRSVSHYHSNKVVLSFLQGNFSVAARHAREVFSLFERSATQYGLAQSILSYAESLLVRGHVDSALEALQRAETASIASGDQVNVLIAGLQRGWLEYQLGDHSAAAKRFSALSSRLRSGGFRVHLANCCLGVANTQIATGELDAAKRQLDSISEKLPCQHMVSDLVLRLTRGRYHMAKSDLRAAQRDFTHAATLARRHGFRAYAFEALLALAQSQVGSGQLDEAEITLRKVVGLDRRLRYRLLEPWMHVALADYAEARQKEREVKRHLLNARCSLIELSHNIGDAGLRNRFLNRPDSTDLLRRSEDVEELVYSQPPSSPEIPRVSRALEGIARINEQLHRRDSLKSTLGLIIDEALRICGAERGIIFLFDPSGRERLKIARNLERQSLVYARNYTRTALMGIRRGEMVYAADTLTDPQLKGSSSVTHHQIRSVACLPLRSRSAIIGALYVDSHRPGFAASPDLLKSLQVFSQQASSALERAIRYYAVAEENRRLRDRSCLDRGSLIGQGSHFARLKELIAAAGASNLPALILGESGTGKELVARAVHESGPRLAEPFLSVDCGALPENLVESELFGFRKGAFTGADRDKEGLLVSARGGTLLLDEVANSSLAIQGKLLRAIQEREIRPLGSTRSVPVAARLLAATNRDLRREVREGRFREDLFFRLSGFTIQVPPLRDRKNDIPLLVSHFLQKASARAGRRVDKISDLALQALLHYDWPGNVRELENSIERAVAFARAGTIELDDLPDSLRSGTVVAWSEKKGEQRMIEEALFRFGGDKTRAAAYIGWNRQKLYRKMAHYNIPQDFGRRNTA